MDTDFNDNNLYGFGQEDTDFLTTLSWDDTAMSGHHGRHYHYQDNNLVGVDDHHLWGPPVEIPPTMDEVPSTELALVPPTTFHHFDCMDKMILHEGFPKIIELAGRIKKARHVLLYGESFCTDATIPVKQNEVQEAVGRIQAQLLDGSNSTELVSRGCFPAIDHTVDEALQALQEEWDHISDWIACVKDTKSNRKEAAPKKRGRAKNEAIAIKYSKWQTDILMKWMIEHKDQPFPDQEAIHELMISTGLTQSQVVNWTTNVRKRNRKATCENGKKPHHFIDFLFLVQVREQREGNEIGIAVPAGVSSSSTTRVRRFRATAKRAEHPGAAMIPLSPGSSLRKPRKRAAAKAGSADDDHTNDELEPLQTHSRTVDEGVMREFADIWLKNGTSLGILHCVTEESNELMAELDEEYHYHLFTDSSLEWDNQPCSRAEV